MGNHYRSILTAWALATVPMLALAVAFVVSVELFRVDLPAGSYYLETDSSHDMPLGSAIYSEIPSTQLTYIASFSSTLATTVLPAVMSLFSYTVALAITRDSDTENHRRLPSPYQLELLISTLNSSLLTLWSFVWYLFSPRRRREAIVPSLSKASSLFSAIAILALLIAMTDAWLNFSVSTVQLNFPHPSSNISLFEDPPPGRGLSPECLDIPSQSPKGSSCDKLLGSDNNTLVFLNQDSVPEDDQDSVPEDDQDSVSQDEQDSVPQDEQDSVSQDEQYLVSQDEQDSVSQDEQDSVSQDEHHSVSQDEQDSVAQDDQLNSTSFLSRLESSSVFKTPQGWLVAPTNRTSNWDFKATTVGSETSCDLVTSLCDIYYESGPTAYSMDLSIEDERTARYACRLGKAGLNLTGKFPDARNGRYFSIKSYTNSSMDVLAQSRDLPLRGPTFWHAVLLRVPVELLSNKSLISPTSLKNTSVGFGYELVYADDDSWVSGILSCSTAVSDVTYSYKQDLGSITVDEWSLMNDTASSAFSLLTPRMLPQLKDGILSSFANASKAADIASGWAIAYDQSLLFSRFSVLRGRPPITLNRDGLDDPATLATMIPRAPFVTLILLDLLYATIATVLMIAAVIAVRKGHGVKDAQARLSILAVVAESFESPAWGDDAKKVDMLFAERRGEGTRRIALFKREGGGRRFKQIVVPQNYVNRPLPVIATTAVSPRPAGSQPIATPTERARYPCQTPVRFSDISPITSREV